MDELLARLGTAQRDLEAQDRARNEALDATRSVIAAARSAINRVHRGDLDGALDQYRTARERAATLQTAAQRCPGLWEGGAVASALQELAEAWALLHLQGVEEPFPGELLTPGALALGLADVVGELRRQALDAMIAGRVGLARARLDAMQALYEALSLIDVAPGFVDVKRRVDVARQLVDRTRGEVALGLIEQRMIERRV